MKNFYLFILVITLFIGCGKTEPTLPQSYRNISFDELMKTLELKKTYSDSDSIIYESEVMNSEKYKSSNFYNYNEPMNDYCQINGGKVSVLSVLDKLETNYLKKQIDYSKVNTFYCKKDKAILFTFFKEEIKNSWKEYPQYKYYFVDSKILSNEVNTFIAKKEQDEFIKIENENIKLNNKIQIAENKVKLINNKIGLIRDNSIKNAFLTNYEKNSFKDTDGVYYFTIINKIDKWGTNKAKLDVDRFVVYKEKQNITEDFTNKILNTIEKEYRFKVKPYKNENLISTGKFDNYGIFETNRDLDLSSLDVIVGFKQINNPDIVRKCNDPQLINSFTLNPDSIKNIRGAHCSQAYSYDAVLYNIIIYDHKIKQIVFYAVSE